MDGRTNGRTNGRTDRRVGWNSDLDSQKKSEQEIFWSLHRLTCMYLLCKVWHQSCRRRVLSAPACGDSYHTKKSMNIRPSQLKGSKPNKAILSSFSVEKSPTHARWKSDFKEKWPYMLCWHERPADSLDTLKQKDDDEEGILPCQS